MKKNFFSLVMGFLIGFIIALVMVSMCNEKCFTYKQTYGLVEWVYYITQPIGVLATTFAVIVAIFGKEIRSFFFREHCRVSLVNLGFYENLGAGVNTPNPVAQSYDCCIKIENDGGKQIENCEIILKEVSFKRKNNDKWKRIYSAEHKALYWKVQEEKFVNLFVGESRTLPLFKIYPESSCNTPDESKSSPLSMRVIGCNLQAKYTQNGYWSGIYEIRSQSKVLCKFEVEVWWEGSWCNRSTEMDEHVSATLKNVKK